MIRVSVPRKTLQCIINEDVTAGMNDANVHCNNWTFGYLQPQTLVFLQSVPFPGSLLFGTRYR